MQRDCKGGERSIKGNFESFSCINICQLLNSIAQVSSHAISGLNSPWVLHSKIPLSQTLILLIKIEHNLV